MLDPHLNNLKLDWMNCVGVCIDGGKKCAVDLIRKGEVFDSLVRVVDLIKKRPVLYSCVDCFSVSFSVTGRWC